MEFISGQNFSGRSAALMESLRARKPAFFIGPYAEAALSGLSGTVADEIDIYRVPSPGRPAFTPLDLTAYAARKPPTLSGGEQVLLALQCFSLSDYAMTGIDTALEQLDPGNRDAALAYLSQGLANGFDAALVDNTLECPAGWTERRCIGQAPAFTCDLTALTATLKPRVAPTIAIAQLSFRYPGGRDIFRALDLTLEPANIYRLTGPNGAGKSTLFKLLAGVLAPLSGSIALDGVPYAPWRTGNRIFALATQNPDHQWCGATLAEDMGRRRAALTRFPGIVVPDDAELGRLAAHLGVHSADQHLYELPLVTRKRLSWLWPFTGTMPWIMFDEPSVGQDRPTRTALAAAISRLAALGHGVVFVTHDDDFAGSIVHRPIRLHMKL
ncbi:MAG: ATP-binding cassette domain-containing protein [Xanthobacteraceae bacterium]